MFPTEFAERMKNMLGEEYQAFNNSYEKEPYRSLRYNPLKGAREEFEKFSPFRLRPVPWEENGYYYEEGERPGKHPYHEAGVYYIQEASAMAPGTYLGAKPGEKILDLCAAPGGKSTQIGAAMQGRGLLICNEIHPARAKILSANIERMGLGNAIVTNESPQALTGIFTEYFDRIMVDAPCSGEGMFRKKEGTCEEWSLENITLCADRQNEILNCAAHMLVPGGTIVYSTCTFAPEENEGSILRFLAGHPEFSVAEVSKYPGMESGRDAALSHAIRLFPHKIEGEGHFLTVLKKTGECSDVHSRYCKNGEAAGQTKKECKEYAEFEKNFMKIELDGVFLTFGEQLYLLPPKAPGLKGLKVFRAGLHLGTVKKNRFEPSHALALFLKKKEATYSYTLTVEEAGRFIGGETFAAEGEKGWYLLDVDGYSLGWGKLAGGIMKNHYPKGLRKNLT